MGKGNKYQNRQENNDNSSRKEAITIYRVLKVRWKEKEREFLKQIPRTNSKINSPTDRTINESW